MGCSSFTGPGFFRPTIWNIAKPGPTHLFVFRLSWLGRFIAQGNFLKSNQLCSMQPAGSPELCWAGVEIAQALCGPRLALPRKQRNPSMAAQQAEADEFRTTAWLIWPLVLTWPHRLTHLPLADAGQGSLQWNCYEGMLWGTQGLGWHRHCGAFSLKTPNRT